MTIYYVAASGGSDSYAGTIAQPFATLAHAVGLVNAGDSIVMRGGTYTLAAMVAVTRNGASGNLITLQNFPNETPILDGGSLTTAGDSCLKFTNVSWWRIVGLEVKNAPFQNIYLTGSCHDNIVERCVAHHAVRLWSSGGGGGITIDGTGYNNLILNCDAHHNGGWGANATAGDGISINYTTGAGNVIRGCRCWRNFDDGFDFWNAANVLIEGNWSWENGYDDTLTMTSGNGTGFKLAGDGTGDGAHTLRYNMAWGNSHNGFDDNSANLPCTLYNNTSYNNTGRSFAMFVNIAHVLRNNLAVANSTVFTTASTVHDHNSWNLNLVAQSSHFLSVDASGASGARQSDGSLPNINYLKPSATSIFLNVGVNVSLPYSGSAPDLGAYEQYSTFYIATNGNDSTGTGAIGAPYATLSKGFAVASAGDTIILRGGTYTYNESVYVNLYDKVGTYRARITVQNYTGETPIINGSGMTTSYRAGLQLNNCSYITIDGLEIKNAAAHGIYLASGCNNIIIQRCNIHHNCRLQGSGAGITLDSAALGSNQILNNDCHHTGISEATGLATSTTGGDGIGNSSQGTGNVIRGNRCYRNNDDGVDLWGGHGCVVERNWSMYNAKFDNGNATTGNGTGYKLGGGQAGEGGHDIRFNMAWSNKNQGFEDNSCVSPMNVFNNTGYNNDGVQFSFYTNVAYVLKNNLSYPKTDNYFSDPSLVHTNNAWDLGVTVTTADFASIDDTGTLAARQSDGSLPVTTFLTLAAGSDLLNVGVDVGLPFSGSSPDLGANEYITASDTTPPTTAITYPSGGTFYQSLTIAATASDNVGVDHVEFYANATLIGTDTTAPYTCDWDPNTWPSNGQVTLTSKAYDAAGNSASSAGVVITVSHWHPSTGAVVGTSVAHPTLLVGTGTHYTLTKYFPTGDLSKGTWTPNAGSLLYDALNESDSEPNKDGDYIQSALNPVNEVCNLAFTNILAPGAGTVHMLSYRIRADIGCPITVALVGGDGSTVVASWTHSGPTAPSDQWTQFDQPLTAGQIAAWAAVGYPNSFLRVIAG